jgi:hypothetical protein
MKNHLHIQCKFTSSLNSYIGVEEKYIPWQTALYHNYYCECNFQQAMHNQITNHLHMHCNFSNSLTTSYIGEEEEYISMTNCYATDLAFTGKGKQEWEPYRHQLPCIGHSPIAHHMKLHWHTWNNLVTKGKLP